MIPLKILSVCLSIELKILWFLGLLLSGSWRGGGEEVVKMAAGLIVKLATYGDKGFYEFLSHRESANGDF